MLFKGKDTPTNRITLYTKFNYAFENYYTTDFYYVPEPITSTDKNSCVYFLSNEPGEATVDWGDGTVETFPFIEITEGQHVCGWRSLNIEYYKNPGTHQWPLGISKETGKGIIPYPNHEYEKNEQHSITIHFSNNITHFNSRFIVMYQFPLIELPVLSELSISYSKYIKEIPADRISKLTELEVLNLSVIAISYNGINHIPLPLFKLTKLRTLNWDLGLDLSNIEGSNIRKIKELKNLTILSLRSCKLSSYLKEFNELPKLQHLGIGNGSSIQNSPLYDEVEQINQNITDYSFLMSGGGSLGGRNNWAEQTAGKGVENVNEILARHGSSLPVEIPIYIKEMRSLRRFLIDASLTTLARMDTFTDNFYKYVTGWDQLTMSNTAKDGKRNQFYGLSIRTYTAESPTLAVRPTGILQAPAGFVQGVSNGNPTTPMEKIYVLTQNYKQVWTLKPEETTTRTTSTPLRLEYNQALDNSMVVGPEGVTYKNEIITLSDEDLQLKEF